MRRAARGLRLGSILLACLAATPSPAAAQILPHAAPWVAFQTEHFNVTFTPELEPLARRAATRAEWAYSLLSRELVRAPDGRIELVLTDNLDFSNGFASPFPRNRIVLYALPPAGEPTLAHHDDWLQLLVLHELVHIFHLDEAGGIWEPLRRIFGRDPILFPQIFTPGWVVEGLATYFESAHTTAGRARGSMFEMIVRTAILEDAFFEIDEASIDPVTWPAGNTRYVYGALFIDHLARRYGPEAVGEYIERFGGNIIPYRLEASARRAFGTTFRREWTAWQDSLRSRYGALADSLRAVGLTVPEILTPEGRAAYHPRFSPDGSRIVYSAGMGREDPSHRLLDLTGRPIADFERTTLGAPSWIPSGGGILFAQLEFEDPYHLRSDLYFGDLTGEVRELTEAGRYFEPDAHPDGEGGVVVEAIEGTNVLALVDLGTGVARRLTEPSLDVYWASPRWSPDGERIAATRWMAGGRFDIVVLDSLGREQVRITDDPHIDLDPAWSPDGQYVLFSSDRSGIPNLYAYELDGGRLWQVTNVLTGAVHPDVSPDGSAIVFSYYRSDGYHIARIPYAPESWRPAPAAPVVAGRGFEPGDAAGAADAAIREYSPFPSILPTYWSPAVAEGEDFGLGVAVAGQDVVERHLWAAEGLVYLADVRFEASAAYRYQGWGLPLLDVQVAQGWAVEVEGDADEEIGTDLMRREREAAVALTWLQRRWRSNRWLQGGIDLTDVGLVGEEGDPRARSVPLDLGASIGFGYSSVRSFGLSLGPQEGVMAAFQVQGRRYLETPEPPASGQNYWRVTGRTRAFQGLDWFGFAPPTLAFRLDGGIQAAAGTSGFSLGGASGQSSGLLIDSWLAGTSSSYPLRGYGSGVQRGNRVFTATAEYRFPIALVESGYGLIPLAIDRFWGDVFVDTGAAWCPLPCNLALGSPTTSPEPLASLGAEAVVDLRLGYVATLPLRFGVAVPVREPEAFEPRVYVRVGASF